MSDDTVLSRRAVYTALSSQIDQVDTLMKAMWLWQDNYSESAKYEASKFVQALCLVLDMQDQFQVLVNEVRRCQMLPDNELLQDPIAQMQNVRTHGDIPDAASVLVPRSFAVLVALLTRGVDEIDRQDITEELEVTLTSRELPKRFIKATIDTFGDGKPRAAPPLAADDYRQVTNDIYVQLCEQYGPIRGDRILSDAVQKAETNKHGRNYSPSNFL
ncbi:MAG: hypothetical protein AAF525_06355 [Pseudomonadota bacterium]